MEQIRQRTPPNAVAITRLVLDVGADPNALAHFYDQPCTTMTMLVSSTHPAQAGLQRELALLLLDRGAAAVDPGTGASAIMTALTFGYLDTARAIERRSSVPLGIPEAAGLGRAQDVERLLSAATADETQAGLALAAQHGHVEVARVLLDGGADPDRYCPEGLHSHATPLHQAVWSGQLSVVELLVERGARRDVRDAIYGSTPLEWAVYGHRTEIAAYLGALERPA